MSLQTSRAMSEPTPSIASRCLKWLSDSIYAHRGWFLYPQLALSVACLWFTFHSLQFNTDRDSLVGADKPYHALFKTFRKEFPVQDDLVVVIESEDFEKNRQFTERLGAYLQAETNLLTGVFFRKDLSMLGNKALIFASTNDLVPLRDQLTAFAPVIQQFTQATNLVALFNEVNRQFRTASKSTNAQAPGPAAGQGAAGLQPDHRRCDRQPPPGWGSTLPRGDLALRRRT